MAGAPKLGRNVFPQQSPKAPESAPALTPEAEPLGPARAADGVPLRDVLALVAGPGPCYLKIVSRHRDQSAHEAFVRVPGFLWHAADMTRPIEDALSWGVPAS